MKKKKPLSAPLVETVDTSYLERFVGYNARRASIVIVDMFLLRMQAFELRPVDFSVLCLVAQNQGITSRQICVALQILPPNAVKLIADLEERGFLTRSPHPKDKRAGSLVLTSEGNAFLALAMKEVVALEAEASARLSDAERNALNRLLKKIYI